MNNKSYSFFFIFSLLLWSSFVICNQRQTSEGKDCLSTFLSSYRLPSLLLFSFLPTHQLSDLHQSVSDTSEWLWNSFLLCLEYRFRRSLRISLILLSLLSPLIHSCSWQDPLPARIVIYLVSDNSLLSPTLFGRCVYLPHVHEPVFQWNWLFPSLSCFVFVNTDVSHWFIHDGCLSVMIVCFLVTSQGILVRCRETGIERRRSWLWNLSQQQSLCRGDHCFLHECKCLSSSRLYLFCSSFSPNRFQRIRGYSYKHFPFVFKQNMTWQTANNW